MEDELKLVKAKEFGIRVAKAMDTIRSSAVFFILQQAFPEFQDDLEWSDFQDMLTRIIEENNDTTT